MKYYFDILLLAGIMSTTLAQNWPAIPCGVGTIIPKLEGPDGFLNITRENSSCAFDTADATQIFIIKTDQLKLKAGDNMQISAHEVPREVKTFEPPFDAGYLVIGAPQPEITFNFNSTDKTYMVAEYLLGVSNITINGDMNNQIFKIIPMNLTELNLIFTKTIADWIHVEIDGALVDGTSLRHVLIKNDNQIIAIKFTGNQKVEVRTFIALASCSGVFKDESETPREITGPVAISKDNYRCVNLFNTSLSHYEANFKNFLDLVEPHDELVLDDGSPSNRVTIDKSGASDFTGQILSFEGQELAVVYNSPRPEASSKIQFRLTVQAKTYGGIIKEPGQLRFPVKGGQVRYLLVPDSQQYVAVEFNVTKIPDVYITVTNGNKVLANFTSNAELPPLIASDEPNARIAVEFSSKSFEKLEKSVSFKSLPSSCHSMSSGRFSIKGRQEGPCYWILASTDDVGLSFSHNDLQPNGCLTIKSLMQDKPLYNKCNLTQLDVLPTFILKQAYVKVDLPSDSTQLLGSLSTSPNNAITILEPRASQEILSPGYPESIIWSHTAQKYALKGAGKDYVLTFVDVDLRSGEKLTVNDAVIERANRTVIDDTTLLKVDVANITVVRPMATADFGPHRGFKISAKQYDRILLAEVSNSRMNLTIPKNLTSLFVKISSPGGSGKFGKRIYFNATSDYTTFNLLAYDGRSVQAPKPLNASTTSDTLLLSFSARKLNETLPQLTITYGSIDCNKTSDHLCDAFTRCVPVDKLCKGVSYCDDGTDLRLDCSGAGPAPRPQVIETGVAGMTVFILCVLMLTLGVVSALYGPDLYKSLENRFRSGQYTTFTSAD